MYLFAHACIYLFQVPVITSKTPEADVGGLYEGKEYQFRVKAVNSEGESEPLETSHAIIAKNPYSEFRIWFSAIVLFDTFNYSQNISSSNFNSLP